ncbi:TonB-dependent receptor [Flavobacterium soli]|uniref:TonB-dependent receptor n=1 Tax=Flavobacterium soli TaxID=344881 RepID=UPI0004262E46|nr:TonB-dependent receptor [Flavobacterium soli]
MKGIFTFLFLIVSISVFSQTKISGKVVDEKGLPLEGANIFIEGTYDGTASDADGNFSFTTTATGTQILKITFLTYESFTETFIVENFKSKTIKLKESMNSLDAVVINAGTLEAGDKARVSVLKPLDIVTTAGSAGDIIAALQSLPGTQTVGESGRLFVRGGEADETQTFVDGLRVAQPYGASANNIPTRGRFSPFLFSGISFSTGGYSAEYGEALSSVLLLNTQDEPVQEETDISLMTVGLGLSNTQKWEKSSLTLNTAYVDLAPYQLAVPQAVDWNRAYQSLSGEAVYRYQFNSGLLKFYTAFEAARFDLNQENINTTEKNRVNLNNNNLYLNTSFNGVLAGTWDITTGLSYGYGQNKIGLDLDDVENTEHASHLKLKVSNKFSDRIKLSIGADYFITQFDESFKENLGDSFLSGYDANIAAAYSEMDIFFSKKLAAKVGFRASNNDLLDEFNLSPRASLAYKTGKFSQFSFAYGDFVQAPRADYLKYTSQLETENTAHYILNYSYNRQGKTFRAEAYYKKYNNLVKFDTPTAQFNSVYENSGSGYAKGLDLFWRDNKTFKNLEYWISYSFIDTQRDYRNFPIQATPSFVAKHTASVVTKYWINSLRSQLGLTHNFNSGRPFENPNKAGFMNGKTKDFHNLNLSWAYLMSPQKILYLSVSNVLGTQNVFGYEFANTPDANGVFNSKPIVPTADRFIFVGFFWTISKDKKTNQLDNL